MSSAVTRLEVNLTPESPSVPDTGILTNTNTNYLAPVVSNAPIILGVFAILTILGIVGAKLCKNKRQANNGTLALRRNNRPLFAISGCAILAILCGIFYVMNPVSLFADQVDDENLISVNATSAGELTLDADIIGTTNVAYVKDTVTFAASEIDYDIYIYTNDALTDTEDGSNQLETITSAGALAPNTYGFSTTDPAEEEVEWQPLNTVAGKTHLYTVEASDEAKTVDFYFGIKGGDADEATYAIEIVYQGLIDFDYEMQSMTQGICEFMDLDQQYLFTDNRDNKQYTIARLQDGNCWMTQNLALGGEASIRLTPDNTDIEENFTLPASGWEWNNAEPAIYAYSEEGNDTETKYGNYYNWAAATAGTSDDVIDEDGFAEGSICPKGWQLPVEVFDNNYNLSAQGEFSNLFSLYNNNLISSPLNFVLAGDIDGYDEDGAYLEYEGEYGDYWTSYSFSGSNSNTSSAMEIRDGDFWNTSYWWGNGFSVRCIAKAENATLRYNENTLDETAVIADMPENQTASITNHRSVFTISDQEPTREGYEFVGWSLKIEGDDTVYEAGDRITTYSQNTTLYAVWNAPYKAVLGTNGNLNFTYLDPELGVGDTYTDNLGQTRIRKILDINTNNEGYQPWTPYDGNWWWSDNNYESWMEDIVSANFDESFYNFRELTNLSHWFHNNYNLASITNVNNIYMNNVIDVEGMFLGAGNSSDVEEFVITGLEEWNTSNVRNMYGLFEYTGDYATTWNIGDLSQWDTSNVYDMQYMFYEAGYSAEEFNIGNIGSWDVSSVEWFYYAFYEAGCEAETWSIGDLSQWDTSSARDMSVMFEYAGYSAEEFNIGNIGSWDVSNVKWFYDMFFEAGYSAGTWYIGDLSQWNTESATDMEYMFYEAGYSAEEFNIGNIGSWDLSDVEYIDYMFYEAGKTATTWNIGDLSDWDTGSAGCTEYMFYGAGAAASTWNLGDLGNWDMSNVQCMNEMFAGAGMVATEWNIGDLSDWDVSSATDMTEMFMGAGRADTTWSIGDLSDWDVSNVESMAGMFLSAGATSATWSIGDLSNWNVGNVEDMSNMFSLSGASASTYNLGNLNNWNVSNVENMTHMFDCAGSRATEWNIGDLSGWNVSNVTRMDYMFRQAGYTDTDSTIGNISSWNTSNVTNMDYMFMMTRYSLDLSGWTVTNVTTHNNFNYLATGITVPAWT